MFGARPEPQWGLRRASGMCGVLAWRTCWQGWQGTRSVWKASRTLELRAQLPATVFWLLSLSVFVSLSLSLSLSFFFSLFSLCLSSSLSVSLCLSVSFCLSLCLSLSVWITAVFKCVGRQRRQGVLIPAPLRRQGEDGVLA